MLTINEKLIKGYEGLYSIDTNGKRNTAGGFIWKEVN